MSRDEIIEAVITIIFFVLVFGSLIWIFLSTDWSSVTDTKPAESNTYTQRESQQKTEGHCSILADKCIVDEWSPKCLWFDCIIDGRN